MVRKVHVLGDTLVPKQRLSSNTQCATEELPIPGKLPDPGTASFSDNFLTKSCEAMKDEMKTVSWWRSMTSAVLMWEPTPTQIGFE